MRIALNSGLGMPPLTLLRVCTFAESLAFPAVGYPESLHPSKTHLQTQTYAFIYARWFTGRELLSNHVSMNGIFNHSQPDRLENAIDPS